MHVLCVHYKTIFFSDHPLLFVTFFRVTLTTVGTRPLTYGFPKKKKKKNFFEIHKINLGRIGSLIGSVRNRKQTVFYFRPKG